MKITNLKELNKRKVLKSNDVVEFHLKDYMFKYRLGNNCLYIKSYSNDYIFEKLGLDKRKLAEECYGYKPLRDGAWPIAIHSDYTALTRLVKKLYEIIEEKYPVEVFEKIESRFDILDIR